MLQLLSTPTATMPASPPTSPALQHNASLPAPTSTTTSGASTTFAEPASWRPYHSHLARVIMTLPGLHAAGDDAPKKQRRMSFSFGAADGGAAADKEYVLEATVSIFAVRPLLSRLLASRTPADLVQRRVSASQDKMDILVSSDSTAPFVRPAGTNAANKPTGGSAHAPMSPPASPETRRKRLSFVNSLPGAGLFFGGNKDREHADGGGHDDSALDLEEHPEMGPGGIRQLRMKTAAAAAAPAPTAAPGSTFAEGTSGADAAAMPEERPHLEADEAKWPLFVNVRPPPALLPLSSRVVVLTPRPPSAPPGRAARADLDPAQPAVVRRRRHDALARAVDREGRLCPRRHAQPLAGDLHRPRTRDRGR